MDRRTVLKTGGMALLSAGFGGCAPKHAPQAAPAAAPVPLRPPVELAPVRVAWDRVIRTNVGLRPHRPSGFVVRADKLDSRTIVHNYGHGGAGHSLAWGTGLLATELAMPHLDRRAAVIGCGTVGLTAARQLQRHGFDVTIYTATVPPDTTSNWALAGFTPVSGLISAPHTPEWDAQFNRAIAVSYGELQLMAGSHYGISWLDSFTPVDEAPEPEVRSGLLPANMRMEQDLLQPGEHPFPAKYAIRSPFLRIEPSIYLDALVRDVHLFGGRIVIRKFDTPRDLMSLEESLIVNCTGLGSRELFKDQDLIALKGQLTVLVPQADVNYMTMSGGGGGGIGIHMLPRGDGIALGGTSERGVWTLEPNEEARQRVVGAHMEFFNQMKAPSRPVVTTRARAPQQVPSVESFFGLHS